MAELGRALHYACHSSFNYIKITSLTTQKGLTKFESRPDNGQHIELIPSSALLLVVSDAASGVAVSPFILLPLPS